MTKKTRSLFVLFALAAGTLVTLATSPASPVKAAEPVESSAIYKITPVESEAQPLGCVYNCPTIKSNTPTFAVQDTVANTVSTATEIDTFNTSAWDQATQAQKSYEGGCAIVSAALKCWGDNSRGQLGNETTTSSLTTPVTATEGGTALSNVTDVSTNGLTTCVVAGGALKCVGAGNWEGNYSKRYNLYETTATAAYPSGGESGRLHVNYNLLNIYNASNSLIYTKTDTNWIPDTLVSNNWTTFTALGSNVAKVQVGSNNNTSTPTICVLLTTGLAKCAVVVAGTPTAISDSYTTEVRESDCDGLTTSANPPVKYEVAEIGCTSDQIGIRTSYERRTKGGSGTLTSSATWTWADAEVTGAVDIAMPADSWGASSICFAGATTICRTFQSGVFGAKKTIENGENSQAVYMTSGFGPPGLCLYSNNTISCGAGTYGTNGIQTVAAKVTAIAVMAKPLNIFFGTSQNMQKLYFLLPTGLLAADGWIFSCSGCQSQSGSVVAPVTAFSASTSTAFTYAKSVNGSTDSADYIPMTVMSGDRKSRSSVAISVKTASGENLTGVSVRWTAPDAPGLLSSSASSTLATDANGAARTTVTSGPVTFTLSVPTVTVCPPVCMNGQQPSKETAPATPSTAGVLASGATLQAASITVIVGDTGSITITVPDAPAIVARKISVTLPDGTPVPNATVQLKNNYLTYAYTNSGTSTSTWSSRPKDTKGYLGQMNCAYCFVAPPKYATGADGSVTFSSFDPASRSSAYDADVAYDDGELNQNVKKTFTSITETVVMPFMAAIKVTLPDADPTTPAKEADADPSTPGTDINVDATGGVTVVTDLVDEDNIPISDFSQSVETVNAGSSCEQGGLVAATDKVTTICASGGVAAMSVNETSRIQAMSVVSAKAKAGCKAMMTATTGSNGKATLKICPTVSTRYRIRATGAIATQTICVRVNKVPCVTAASVGKKSVTIKKGKLATFATINKTTKIDVPKGAKVALVVAAKSKKFCSVSGTSVKALSKGSCIVSVKVTPKATAKVKKPATTTTNITVSIP